MNEPTKSNVRKDNRVRCSAWSKVQIHTETGASLTSNEIRRSSESMVHWIQHPTYVHLASLSGQLSNEHNEYGMLGSYKTFRLNEQIKTMFKKNNSEKVWKFG